MSEVRKTTEGFFDMDVELEVNFRMTLEQYTVAFCRKEDGEFAEVPQEIDKNALQDQIKVAIDCEIDGEGYDTKHKEFCQFRQCVLAAVSRMSGRELYAAFKVRAARNITAW